MVINYNGGRKVGVCHTPTSTVRGIAKMTSLTAVRPEQRASRRPAGAQTREG
jgi:alpha-galactosidase/6-phospho-beta-glucosidase family protein